MADRRRIIAVTGASGFVGRALLSKLGSDPQNEARGLYRSQPTALAAGSRVIGDLAEAPDLSGALAGAGVVIHTAARTHVLDDREADPLAAYRRVNVDGTMALAHAAVAAGVKRLVFLSSIKVNGESTPIDRPFREADTPAPLDAYGVTKLEAEQALSGLARESGLEVVVLRPPLVYGPGVKGNMARLVRLVARGVPMPFGSIHNKRSMIGLGNLVAAVLLAADHPAAAGRTFLAADPHDMSTPELIRAIAAALSKPARLLPFPPALLLAGGVVLRRRAEIERLTGSLRVDAGAITRDLGWAPETNPAAEIERMVAARVE